MPDRASIIIVAQDLTSAAMKSVEGNLQGVRRAVDQVQNSFAAVLGATGIAAFQQKIVDETLKAENAVKRLDAVVMAAGRDVGVTRAEMRGFAEDLAAATKFDDNGILEAQAVLVKFGNVTGDVFRRTIRLAADVASFMGSDMPAAAQLLGRAVQSPTEGLRALEREFGKLTVAEKEHIETLVAQGRTLEAQNAILDLVQRKVGGVAELMNSGLIKATADSRKEFDRLLETLGQTEVVGGALQRRFETLAGIFRDIQDAIKGSGDPLDTYRRQLGAVQQEIERIEKNRPARGRSPLTDERLAELRAQERSLAAVINGVGRNLNDPANFDARDLRLRTPNLQPELGGAAHGGADDPFKSLLDQYQRSLAMVGELSEQEKALKLLQTDRYKDLDTAQKTQILQLARAIDFKKMEADVGKAEIENETKGYRALAEAQQKEEEQLQRNIARWKDLADPTAKIVAEMRELEEAFRLGRIDEDVYFGAAIKLSEQYSAELEKIGKKTQENREFAKSLGLTFASSFEEAVLKGAKLDAVIVGIINDVGRLVLRKTVTEPGAEALGGFLFGSLFAPKGEPGAGDFSAGGGFDPDSILTGLASGGFMDAGGAGGTDSQVVAFRKSPWEAVDVREPGGMGAGGQIVQHIHFEATTPAAVRAAVYEAAPRIAEMARAVVFDTNRRGVRS